MSQPAQHPLYRPEFMEAAIELSKESIANGGGPFGAVVVRNNRIIAKGSNRVTQSSDPTAHAEVVAIREACKQLQDFQLPDCVLYTSCEPCPMCLGAIYWARPKLIFFANTKADAAAIGFDDAFIYEEIQTAPKERFIPMLHVENEAAKKVFQSWDTMEDKTPY